MAKKDSSPCIFCAIASKDIDAEIVGENDLVLAFRDINPAASQHVLIIPKNHLSSISDLTADDAPMITEMLLMAKDLAKKLGVKESGYRLVINNGEGVGQSVFHLHIHLLAGRSFAWPPG